MGFQFETLGNATLQFFRDGQPLLATDPWLAGTAYFGSWSLDHALAPEQIRNVQRSPYLWISHGHPDHLHEASLPLLSRESTVLLPSHYSPAVANHLRAQGFRVETMRFKQWRELGPGARAMCLEDENQDAMLIVEAGGALVIDKNDAPACGEEPFLRRLVRANPKSYLCCLCSIDADMFHLVDAAGNHAVEPPEVLKPGAVWDLGDFCTYLGVPNYLCSSSQHLYVRQDTQWANPYRITFADMQKWWNAPATRLVEPFVTVDLESGAIRANHPGGATDLGQILPGNAEDDWNERMSAEDWRDLEARFAKYGLLAERLDFLRFTVGGETRTIALSERARRAAAAAEKGIHFRVPRRSLMATVRGGFVDDLLIGNFMQTELIGGASLYPDFTPLVAKLGDNAEVYTREQLRAFRRHYFRLSPAAWMRYRRQEWWKYRGKPALREMLSSVGLLESAKRAGRKLASLPPLPSRN